MSSIYPDAIDGFSQLPLAIDTVTPVKAETVNRLRDAIVKIETELGVTPSGNYETLADRVEYVDSKVSQVASVVEVNGSLSLDNTHGIILVDTSAGNITITLPLTSSGVYRYTIKKVDSSSNSVIVTAQGASSIDGAATLDIDTQYQFSSIINTNTDWFLV